MTTSRTRTWFWIMALSLVAMPVWARCQVHRIPLRHGPFGSVLAQAPCRQSRVPQDAAPLVDAIQRDRET